MMNIQLKLLFLQVWQKGEEESIAKLFEHEKGNKDLVIYSCTSVNIVPFCDVCLPEIEHLEKLVDC